MKTASTAREGEARRRRASRLRHDAEDQQPWRCVGCGEAVSMIRHNPCACTRKLMAASCSRCGGGGPFIDGLCAYCKVRGY